MILTTNQHDILQHALGLHERNGVTYRNYYVCGEDAFINDLIAKGLMQKGPAPTFLHKEDIVYRVTDEGRKVALEEHKRRYPLFKYEDGIQSRVTK